MQNDLPRNPHLATQIQAKSTMLQNPTLAADIINGQFYSAVKVNSTDGRRIPIIAVFPQANMRGEASQAVQNIKSALPPLEDFMATPFTQNFIHVWYGFMIGNMGGSGTIYTEDQTSYNARKTATMMPYEPVLAHELSHSYIGHESLNQFLEIYTYNMAHTNNTNMQSWTYTHDYATWNSTKTGYAALLDIYQLIGRDAMANAYRTIYPLHPPYGQTLSAECKQAFIDQAPTAQKAQVSSIVANITY